MKLLLTAVSTLLVTLGAATVAQSSPDEQGAGPVEFGFVERTGSEGQAPTWRRLDLILLLRADDRAIARAANGISRPGSGQFRRYLDSREIADRFGPGTAALRRVIDRLTAAGMKATSSPDGLMVEATATVGQAESLFSTDLRTFSAPETDDAGDTAEDFIAPESEPSVPPSLAGEVEAVVGLDTEEVAASAGVARKATRSKAGKMTRKQGLRFNRAAARLRTSIRANTGAPRGCGAGRNATTRVTGGGGIPKDLNGTSIPAYTPNQIHSAYGIDALHRKGLAGKGQRIAVVEIDGFKRSDLEKAARCFGFEAPRTPVKLIGLKKRLAPGLETTLDLQVLSAAVPEAREIRVVQGPANGSGLVQQYAYLLGLPRKKRPSIISASLGACEADLLKARPYIKAMERLYRIAAIKGVTMIASSGDTGSSGCTLDGNSMALPKLSVQYGASSPWVTGVGGTNFALDQRNRITEEVVWNDSPLSFGGGTGGSSVLFGQPGWQRGPGVGKSGKRSVPDLAMLADNVPGWSIYCTIKKECGGWTNVGGTSAAAPLTAAVALLANQRAGTAGRPSLGFMNPSIYRIARNAKARKQVFRDVRRIGNDLGRLIGPKEGGQNRPLGCCRAKPDYDRASGWGSLKAPRFIDHMIDLPRSKPK